MADEDLVEQKHLPELLIVALFLIELGICCMRVELQSSPLAGFFLRVMD